MSGPRWLLFPMVALLLSPSLGGLASNDHPGTTDHETCSQTPINDAPTHHTINLHGGQITLPIDFEAGDRFLQTVTPPVFTRTEQARQDPDLQPGDDGDQAIVTLERRHTDYSYMEEDWTGGICIQSITGTPTEYVCICDATFIMTNKDGLDPTRPIRIFDSEYLWFDNLTVYGGAIDLWQSQQLIVSNSLFIDSNGILTADSSHGYVHNITVSIQRPPTNMIHHPPQLPDASPIPGGRDFMCWPHVEPPPCEGGGVFLHRGENWTVEWSHFQGSGGAGTPGAGAPTDTRNITIRHNTFRDTALQVTRGENEISWNLIRGNQIAGPRTWSSDYTSYHNNSIIMPFKIDHRVPGINANPGVWVQRCTECDIRHNDFIGYGIPDYSSVVFSGSDLRYPALLACENNHITANDNYWGTIHDPRTPPHTWIKICHPEDTTLILDRWETEPIHNITPIMYTLDHRDIPYWLQRLTDLDP